MMSKQRGVAMLRYGRCDSIGLGNASKTHVPQSGISMGRYYSRFYSRITRRCRSILLLLVFFTPLRFLSACELKRKSPWLHV